VAQLDEVATLASASEAALGSSGDDSDDMPVLDDDDGGLRPDPN
jgi:hypothetical protein